MKNRTSFWATLIAIMLGATLGVLAQLPGPPVGIPQTVQSSTYGYLFGYTFTPNTTTGAGVRIAPTLSLINGTSQNDYILDVAGTIALPTSGTTGTLFAGIHAGTLTCTLNSGTLTTCANLVVDAAPSTGTNKYSAWFKGDVAYGPTTPVSMSGSLACGNGLAANGTCANTSTGGTFKVLSGTYLLTASTSTVSGISPAFTSSSTWNCVANDVTTRANVVQAIPSTSSAFIITNTTGISDTISVICAGY